MSRARACRARRRIARIRTAWQTPDGVDESLLYPVVRVELNRFRGRLFVTGGRGSGWGTAVAPDATANEVGDILLRALEGEGARRVPLVDTLESETRRSLAATRGWERFCLREVGVRVAEYRPEIRIEVYDAGEGALVLRPRQGRTHRESEMKISLDAGATELGGAVLALLEATVPERPTIRSALVHAGTRKRLVIFPIRPGRRGHPVRVVSIDAAPEVVGVAVLLALEESERIDEEIPVVLERTRWEQAMSAAGVGERQIAGRRASAVEALSDGTVRLTALVPIRGDWASAGDGGELTLNEPISAADVGRAVIAAVVKWDRFDGSHVGSAL